MTATGHNSRHMSYDDQESPAQTERAALAEAVRHLRSGRLRDAEALFLELVDAHPHDSRVLNSLGVIAARNGRLDEAVSRFNAAIAANADDADAHENLGRALAQRGRLDEAAQAVQQAVRLRPDHASTYQLLGNLLLEMEQHERALHVYRRAHACGPELAAVHCSMGAALKELGSLDEALQSYRRAVALEPDFAQAHSNMGAALNELGRYEDAENASRTATQLAPDFAMGYSNLGVSLMGLARPAEALEAYRRAVELQPDFAHAHCNLGNALRELGDLDAALAAYARAIELDPRFSQAFSSMANVFFHRGDARAGVETCDRFLAVRPRDCRVLACKSVILGELGARERVPYLHDHERLVWSKQCGAPTEFGSLKRFHEALEEHICGHPSLAYAPTSHATRLGRHTGELLTEPKGPIAQLEQMVDGAMDEYLRSIPANLRDPFFSRPAGRLRKHMWGVVLEAQGHQIPHIHPTSWLSGVYYVKLPAIVEEIEADEAGWIEFGRPGDEFHCKVDPPVRRLKPMDGLMVLFPSFLYHRTIPFDPSETRISIAFDIFP